MKFNVTRREHDEETLFEHSDGIVPMPDAAADSGVLAINSDGEVMLNTGTYYLAQSISVSNINIVGDVILCLNGYNIEGDRSNGAESNLYLPGELAVAVSGKLTGTIGIGKDSGNMPTADSQVKVAAADTYFPVLPDGFRYSLLLGSAFGANRKEECVQETHQGCPAHSVSPRDKPAKRA